MLQKYLDIEQTRFGSRLSVRDAHRSRDARRPGAEPAAAAARRKRRAPRHRAALPAGADRRSTPSRVGGRLRLQVRDSGDGLPPDRLTLLNQGVGLANTRARLAAPLSRRTTSSSSRTPTAGFCVIGVDSVRGRSRRHRTGAGGCGMTGRSGRWSSTTSRSRGRGWCRCCATRPTSRWSASAPSGRQAKSAIAVDLARSAVPRHPDAGDGRHRPGAHASSRPGAPAVVFVTAYDEYALRAFEVHALDYLLKPFSAERFRSALGHAREHLAQRRATSTGALVGACGGDAAPPSRRHPADDQVERPHLLRADGRHRLVRGRRATTSGCTSARSATWCATP